MSKRITKVKFKRPTVEIHLEEHLKTTVKESVIRSTEAPHPDLELSLAGLVGHVYDILELERGSWKAGLTVTGVSFSKSEDTGVEGAVITFQVALEGSHAPFCGNTPHLPFEAYTEGSEAPTMDSDCVHQLEKVRAEAQAFIDGSKRAQQELALATEAQES